LEPTANQVVRSSSNTLVVAGPGAGKTELLAQRACFLVETGTCSASRRILAISFKRDAAKNLRERVQKRCGDHAQRFDSYTLDAFAKGLVDRFLLALPEAWRPRIGYEVMTRGMTVHEMREWLDGAEIPEGHAQVDLESRSDNDIKRVFDRITHGHVLPYSAGNIHPMTRHWGLRWWREQLSSPLGRPSLSFPMLNRLAAFLLRCNPKVIAALRATYTFVFLDEFQDTTEAQYDLIRAAFLGSTAVLTAVGDSKQRIMLWAGAMIDVFESYQTDFEAELHHLVSNYRSAPELVRMQHIIAQGLEAGTPLANAVNADLTGSCALKEFASPEDEADHLAELIEQGIRAEGKKVRDFCILVRQRTGDMIEFLKVALSDRGIRLRDESQLQDLLAEPVVKFLLALFRLATRPRDAEAWDILVSEIATLFGLDNTDDASKIEKEAKQLLQHAREALNAGHSIATLPPELVAMVGDVFFRSAYTQYRRGSYLKDTVDGLSAALQTSVVNCPSVCEAVDDVVGVNVVPAMTIHKSKGLEFHTVIFLGLEDSQWWAFSNQPDEEKRGFFVAFSRACECVYFTFCDVRDERWGRKLQRRAQIGDLYTILKQAGVPTLNHRDQED
jgi:superfamily I DNA/RNA helicase